MKKLFLIFIIFLIFICLFVFTFPILGKYISGTARIVGKETKSEIYINGKKEIDAKLFISNSNFEETQIKDYLILYLRNVKNLKSFSVIIIDKKHKLVMYPNAGKSNYDLVFSYLFQSDSGANVMVPINDITKGLGFKPHLEVRNDRVKFKFLINNKPLDIIIKIK